MLDFGIFLLFDLPIFWENDCSPSKLSNKKAGFPRKSPRSLINWSWKTIRHILKDSVPSPDQYEACYTCFLLYEGNKFPCAKTYPWTHLVIKKCCKFRCIADKGKPKHLSIQNILYVNSYTLLVLFPFQNTNHHHILTIGCDWQYFLYILQELITSGHFMIDPTKYMGARPLNRTGELRL